MSIVSEITRINNNISNAYAKLEEKGATMPTDRDSNNLANTIDSLVLSSSNVTTDIINGTITTVDQEALGQVESIRANAFYGLNIETVSVPSNVAVIGNSAFANNNITSLSLGDGVTTIGDSAFQNNSISTLTIPASVTTIGDSAFEGNVLTEITMESDVPPTVTETTFPDTLQATNVSYNGYPNYVSDPNWQTYKDTLVRGLAIPSTITVIVNDYTGALVSGASVTISGNGQTYTGTTDSVGVFTQGDLQPATYTISVADMEGFKTPDVSEVVVEEDTQNSVTVTYLEKPQFTQADRTFSNNSPEIISKVSKEISDYNMTSERVTEIYGWNIGDTIAIKLSTGQNIDFRIIGFNHDNKADGSGKAGITLESTTCLNDSPYFYSTTGAKWVGSSVRTTLKSTVKDRLPQDWQNVIITVAKGYTDYNQTTGANASLKYSNDSLFILSTIEINPNGTENQPTGSTTYEYYSVDSAALRAKDANWWTRSIGYNYGIIKVMTDGTTAWADPKREVAQIAFAFCV